MNDSEFLQAFEQCALPHHDFPHRAHVRLAWLYVRENGWEKGTAKIRAGIQKFAQTYGVLPKYHETITLFWAHLIYRAIACSPEINDFAAFAVQYPALLDAKLLAQFYSPELLKSDAARAMWVEPDLKPLPALIIG